MKKIKYSIIGLETESTISLTSHLSNFGGYISVGSSEDPNRLLDVILSGAPNLILINVDDYSKKDHNYLRGTVKDLYRSLLQKPLVVALSSSKKQAYNCIKNNFFYYLLHPISGLQLQKLDYKLRANYISNHDKPKKLCLQTYSDYRFIEIKDILFLKADNNTTEFFMRDKTKIVAFKTLKYFESILPKTFRRIHQSFIINQYYISRIHLGKSECHLQPIKRRLPFSKSYRKVMTELATTLSSSALT